METNVRQKGRKRREKRNMKEERENNREEMRWQKEGKEREERRGDLRYRFSFLGATCSRGDLGALALVGAAWTALCCFLSALGWILPCPGRFLGASWHLGMPPTSISGSTLEGSGAGF